MIDRQQQTATDKQWCRLREIPFLLLLCTTTSIITTSLLFSDVYTSFTHSSGSLSLIISDVGLVRKSALSTITYTHTTRNNSLQLDNHHQENFSTNHSIYSDTTRQYNPVATPFHSNYSSVFKTWNHKVVTRIRPSLQHNCSLLMSSNSSSNTSEFEKVAQFLNHSTPHHVDFANVTNCSQILHEFYDNYYVSESERSFPLAFTLVVYTNVHQILRFLKAIYRPQNVYCIHPDLNSGNDFIKHFKTLESCLPNVFVPSKIKNVNYKHPKTILEAQLNCLRDLESRRRRRAIKWKYVINLCGRELPMKTNRFIVKNLRKMEGVSVLRAYPIDKNTFKERFTAMRHKVAERAKCKRANLECITKHESFIQKNSLKLYKSMTYNALSFQFVRHLLHDPAMLELTQWMLANCTTPEEHFYATAYMIPGTPGGYNTSKSLPLISKSIWKHDKSSHHKDTAEKCAGKIVHQVCILSSADLPLIGEIMRYNVWFVNKYFMEEDHIVMDCVEERLISANEQEFRDDHRSLMSH